MRFEFEYEREFIYWTYINMQRREDPAKGNPYD